MSDFSDLDLRRRILLELGAYFSDLRDFSDVEETSPASTSIGARRSQGPGAHDHPFRIYLELRAS